MAGKLQDEIGERRDRLKERMSDRQARMFDSFVFLVKFTALAAPLYLILGSGWNAHHLREAVALLSSGLVEVLGVETAHHGSFISSGNLLVDVTRDSTGWKSVMVFAALVFATGKRLSYKIKGLAVGTAAIFVVNLLRISTMIYAVRVFEVEYELLHMLLWRWGLTFVVLSLWIFWFLELSWSSIIRRM
ncbi:MAG: exosortase/archaeosortase family protein [Candidatus Nanohaloarchaea archaeon]|nr:exosortase/archaeosortase family protein [Candidatus Nanohaloarchaea archaeon]